MSASQSPSIELVFIFLKMSLLHLEKIKFEQLSLQIQVHSINATINCIDENFHNNESLRRKMSVSPSSNNGIGIPIRKTSYRETRSYTKRGLYSSEYKQSICTNVETPLTEK